MKFASRLALAAVMCLGFCFPGASQTSESAYLLGPDDQIQIGLNDLKEIDFKPVRIDAQGDIRLTYTGVIHAAGLSTTQLAAEITKRLGEFVNNPRVTVEITEFGSQPVSVLGAVNRPGVIQLKGRRSLLEVLSLVEGLRTDAGNSVKITRDMQYGPLTLPGTATDPEKRFTTASVSVSNLMAAKDPASNITLRPHDVISVPRAEMVYVVGSVKKPGGFVLNEKESVSVLQAISMAEGMDNTAAPAAAKILRSKDGTSQRFEIPVNVKSILASKSQDQQLQPNDILFVPNSAAKNAALRSLEAGLQMATGVVIFRR